MADVKYLNTDNFCQGFYFFQELCQSVYDKNKSQGESTSDLPAEDGEEAEVAGEMKVN